MKLDSEMELLLNEIPLLHHGDVLAGAGSGGIGLHLIQELSAMAIHDELKPPAVDAGVKNAGSCLADHLPFLNPENFASARAFCPFSHCPDAGVDLLNASYDPFSCPDGWDLRCSPPRSRRKACKAAKPTAKGLKYESLAGVRGFMYHIAMDQYGCRFLQHKLDEGRHQVDFIFAGIARHAVELMVNPFGNYLMQKLLSVCDEEQRMAIALLLTKDPLVLVRVALNVHGTRAVQKLIESLRTREEIHLVIAALHPGFLDLIKDPNGNHVVQRCLQSFDADDNKPIFDAAAVHCVNIGMQRHGCCVLQRCIAHSSGEHKEKLIAAISCNGFQLAQDAYGNYVVQYVLDLKIPTANASLAHQFEGKYIHLAMQKFSSNVVEKCLKVFRDADRANIVLELLSVPHFDQLLQHPYANYVIYSALQNSKGPLHTALTSAIRPHVELLRTSPYCKRIYSRALLKK